MLEPLRKLLQEFVDEHLPNQRITQIDLTWHEGCSSYMVQADVDDYSLWDALDEIDSETRSNLIGLLQTKLETFNVILG